MLNSPTQELCPRCFDDPALDERLLSSAMDYAASLPQDACVPDAVYQVRLHECSSCQHLSRGVCQKCGCFVVVRARRRSKSCPAGSWESSFKGLDATAERESG